MGIFERCSFFWKSLLPPWGKYTQGVEEVAGDGFRPLGSVRTNCIPGNQYVFMVDTMKRFDGRCYIALCDVIECIGWGQRHPGLVLVVGSSQGFYWERGFQLPFQIRGSKPPILGSGREKVQSIIREVEVQFFNSESICPILPLNVYPDLTIKLVDSFYCGWVRCIWVF